MTHSYTCGICGENYISTWSDEEAMEELKTNMPETIDTELAVVCDDCYKEFMQWLNTKTDEEKKLMRDLK